MKYRRALGEILRETRHDLKLNLRDVSKRSSVALGYLSEIERGHKEVSSEVLESIAAGLGVPLSKLIQATAIRIRIHEPIDIADFQFDELGLVV